MSVENAGDAPGPRDGAGGRGRVAAGDDRVVHEAPCRTCGYNLVGLSVRDVCPECASAIAATVPACPRCLHSKREQRALKCGKAGSVDTWECRSCGGAGIDRAQLRAAIEHERKNGLFSVRPAGHDLVAQMPARCGRCRCMMTAIFIDDSVLVDRCDVCGFVWLDEGELPAVAAWMNRHGGTLKTPQDVGEILGDEKEVHRRSIAADDRREIISGLTTPLAVRIAILIVRLIARV